MTKPNTALALTGPAQGPAPKPAAPKADKSAAFRERLAKALAGQEYPAADNSAAWMALLSGLPAVAEEIARSRSGKYKDKTMVPGAGLMVTCTPTGLQMAATGTTKEGGKPTAQAATCRAVRNASSATGGGPVCKAAAVFFMLTDSTVLAVLHACKATDGNGKARVTYIGRTQVPCPAWAAGYVQGNVRADYCKAG